MASPIEVPFESARELVDFISPLNPIWDAGRYVFRGQPSDAHKLTPSVCRRDEGSFAYGSAIREFSQSISGQIFYELEILSQFLRGCDRSGLIVPGYTKDLKNQFASARGSFLSAHRAWPQAELHEVMAVAQHYGVPTRLLDWTDRSFVACYFSAASAEFEISSMKMPRIAIWALDTKHSSTWDTVSIIRTTGGTSKNQAAQSRLFTTHSIKEFSEELQYEPEALEDTQEIYSPDNRLGSLIKITLPVEQAPELLTLCSKLGVDGSTLFPGYQGVAQNVRDWANTQVGVRPSPALWDDYHQEHYGH